MIEALSAEHGLTKAVSGAVLDSIVGFVQHGLKANGRVVLTGLGTFTVAKRAARTGRNPSTGAALKIKASKVARFKAAPALKESAAKFKG
ncbi:HU family DNA-binding protein [Undibacterium arcticum]